MGRHILGRFMCFGNPVTYTEPKIKVCINNNLFQTKGVICNKAIKYHNGMYYCHANDDERCY